VQVGIGKSAGGWHFTLRGKINVETNDLSPREFPMSVNPIPAGFHTIAPNIIVKNIDAALSFCNQAISLKFQLLSIQFTSEAFETGRKMHYEKAPRFRRSRLGWAPPPLRCAVQGFAPLRRRSRVTAVVCPVGKDYRRA
jgi:hypothetical protein